MNDLSTSGGSINVCKMETELNVRKSKMFWSYMDRDKE